MLKFLSRRRLSIFRVAFAVQEGVVIGLAAKTPVLPMVSFCVVVTAIRLRLESSLPVSDGPAT
jgi:hypothetical protein